MDALGSALALRRILKKNYESEDNKIQIDVFTDTPSITSDDLHKNMYYPFVEHEEINKKNSKKNSTKLLLLPWWFQW